jgi:predicted amidophosphoribosyltransferase
MVGKEAYLIAMLGVIVAVGFTCVPPLFRKRCPNCGARNTLDAASCRRCSQPFPMD